MVLLNAFESNEMWKTLNFWFIIFLPIFIFNYQAFHTCIWLNVRRCAALFWTSMCACPIGLQMRQKLLGIVTFVKEQWTLVQHKMLFGLHRLHALFSLIILMVLLAVLVSFWQSSMQQMWSFLETPLFCQTFSPKILWELLLLRFLAWGYQLSFQTLGAVWCSSDRIRGRSPLFLLRCFVKRWTRDWCSWKCDSMSITI